ncbi:MAG: hypothetical protein ACREQA_08405 [Candidatus Binatia bacterium]
MSEKRLTRREAIKKAAYMTPFILTLAVTPSFASSGTNGPSDTKRRSRGGGCQWWEFWCWIGKAFS